MDKVYIVTVGEYSDYHIQRVYPERTPEVEEYAKRVGGKIEEWPLGVEEYWSGKRWRDEWRIAKKGTFYDFKTGKSDPTNRVAYEAGWVDDPALPEYLVLRESRWEDYDGVKPPSIEAVDYWNDMTAESLAYFVNTGRRDSGAPWMVVVGYEKEHVVKALNDRITRFKARLIGIA